MPFFNCTFALIQEKERKARRKGKPMQSEETSSSYPAEEEEMEGSGASGNEEEAPEDGEGLPAPSLSNDKMKRSTVDALVQRRSCNVSIIWREISLFFLKVAKVNEFSSSALLGWMLVEHQLWSAAAAQLC